MKWGRHIIFWLVYCIYFYIQSISPQTFAEFTQPILYRNALVSICCFIPFCALSVYVSTLLIFPRYIETKRYGAAVVCFVAMFLIGGIVNYFAATTYYSISGWHAKGPVILGYLNTLWAMIIAGFAIGLKAIRKWYLLQKQIFEIIRNKARNELNLQKKRMHPKFLCASLDRINDKLRQDPSNASEMILTLSDVLSFSLYESENEFITLQHEIAAVEDFITLEQDEDRRISLTVDENVDIYRLLVTPSFIFSALQQNYLKVKESGVTKCDTDIVIKTVGKEILAQLHFTGLCADEKMPDPINIRLPLRYADNNMNVVYDAV